MNQPFQKLNHSKQKRILNAALKEFADHGYEKASTNRIVKEAGIGKGMLFYYFNSKKDLFEYVIHYSIDVMVNEYFNLLDPNEPDLIERLKKATQVKIQCVAEHPYLFYFLGAFFVDDELDVSEKTLKRLEQLRKWGYSLLYDNIDLSLFRDDLDTNKAFNMIRWFMDGYENEIKMRLKNQKLSAIDFDPYWEEFYGYVDLLKKSFYR